MSRFWRRFYRPIRDIFSVLPDVEQHKRGGARLRRQIRGYGCHRRGVPADLAQGSLLEHAGAPPHRRARRPDRRCGRAWSACSPAFGGHPASIVPAAYSSVPKTGQNRRTSRPHLALRGTTWHYVAQGAPYMYARTCAFEGPLGSPRRAIQPSSREKTAHDLRVGELQWPPEDGENVTNRTVNAPLKTGQNTEIGNAAVRAASGERAARARLPITVIDRQSLGEALAWWRKSYAT